MRSICPEKQFWLILKISGPDEAVLINKRRVKKNKKKQVKPPTIPSAASWPRLQFQLTAVDDDAANHLWLGDAAWMEGAISAGSPPDTRAHVFLEPTQAF